MTEVRCFGKGSIPRELNHQVPALIGEVSLTRPWLRDDFVGCNRDSERASGAVDTSQRSPAQACHRIARAAIRRHIHVTGILVLHRARDRSELALVHFRDAWRRDSLSCMRCTKAAR